MPLGPRLKSAFAASAVTLALLPATALAQGAGDDQYSDPFGDDSEEQAQPTPTPRAPSATAALRHSQPAAAPPGQPGPRRARHRPGPTLPYTGIDGWPRRRRGAAARAPASRSAHAFVSRTELTADRKEPSGRRAARRPLAPGDVVLVSGELGAGKTTFVRGALRSLGVEGPITSPTFVVGHLHERKTVPSHTSTSIGSRAWAAKTRPFGPVFQRGHDRVRGMARARRGRMARRSRRRARAAGARRRRRSKDRDRTVKAIVGIDTATSRDLRRRAGSWRARDRAPRRPGPGRAPAARGDAPAAARAARSSTPRWAGRTSGASASAPGRAASPGCGSASRPRARWRRATISRSSASRAWRRWRAGSSSSSSKELDLPGDPDLHGPVLALIDARRGEVFAASYRHHRTTMEATAIAPDELADAAGRAARVGALADAGRG